MRHVLGPSHRGRSGHLLLRHWRLAIFQRLDGRLREQRRQLPGKRGQHRRYPAELSPVQRQRQVGAECVHSELAAGCTESALESRLMGRCGCWVFEVFGQEECLAWCATLMAHSWEAGVVAITYMLRSVKHFLCAAGIAYTAPHKISRYRRVMLR